MPKRTDIHKILVIGSGPIVIGQAAEFDYAGTQACLALKEEGYEVVLCNSNPATIMTDTSIADKVYMEPLTLEYIAKIVRYERPDAILPGIGGQTGLNLAMQLEKKGVLRECGVELLGTRSRSIERAEDRELFKELCEGLGEPVLPSEIANSMEEGLRAAEEIGYPVVLRPAFTLGGTGGGFAENEEECREILKNALKLSPVHQVLVEKSIKGFKEIEYEVMRDANGTAITICNMENLDPVGIHTGDSIVVCPSQTLTNKEYHMLRDSALKIIRALQIEGGCNVQFALDPKSFQYYLIEVNPRVSRSSALASKASGYPIARVSAKIGVGMHLDEIPIANTPACFEPALDYVVTKMPRFPFDKFTDADTSLGTQMKATGEVMSIGRTFEESLLKAIRSLETGQFHLHHSKFDGMTEEELLSYIQVGTDDRIYAIAQLLRRGTDPERIHEATAIDLFFIRKLRHIIDVENQLREYGEKVCLTVVLDDRNVVETENIQRREAQGKADEEKKTEEQGKTVKQDETQKKNTDEAREEKDKKSAAEYENRADTGTEDNRSESLRHILLHAKRTGFSDKEIALLWGMTEQEVFEMRQQYGIVPVYKMIDTCASEFDSYIPYFYSTYETENESVISDRKKIVVLGAGPIRIGQGVEFDYSTVHAVQTIREAGYEAIIINNNPETVSTDYTCSDKLYFEPLCVEDVMNILVMEKPEGVIATLGGQTAINLADPLRDRGVKIIGTDGDAIDRAEDRDLFENLLIELGIPEPKGLAVTTIEDGVRAAEEIGYPVLVRPSFVLGGRAMQIVAKEKALRSYLETAVSIGEDKPVLVDKYVRGKEVEVDAVCDGKDVFVPGIMEQVERTGVHSGDSISIYPPVSISQKVRDTILDYTRRLGLGIGIIGLFNIQFIVDEKEDVYVIEVNPRSSRTVPYLSKATGWSLADIATRVILGHSLREQGITAEGMCGEKLREQDITAENLCGEKLREQGITAENLCGEKLREQGITAENLRGEKLREQGITAENLRGEKLREQGITAENMRSKKPRDPREEKVIPEGKKSAAIYPREKSRYYVKVPEFSFSKLQGMDSYLSPEMKSTGEAIGYDKNLSRAMYKAMTAAGMKLQNYGTVVFTLADEDKEEALPLVRRFYNMGFNIEATTVTAEFLKEHGIRTKLRRKLSEGSEEILDRLRSGYVSYLICTRAILSGIHYVDGVAIRRCAAQNGITMLTSLDTVRVLLDVLEDMTIGVSTIDAE